MTEQMNLFDRQDRILDGKQIISIDGDAILYNNFFDLDESDRLFAELNSHINWKQDSIGMFGKYIPLPRLTAWYGDEGKIYTYSGIENHPHDWNSTLLYIKRKIEPVATAKFNSVLLNLYRDGKDSMSWHSDDEPELGRNPIIGSVTFGATRRFSLKHKHEKSLRTDIDLTPGSLLLMRGATQSNWQHQIPKTKKEIAPRINLTFRTIVC